MRTLKTVLIGWALSFFIMALYLIFIVSIISRVKVLDDTFIQKVICYPLISIIILGPFLLLYAAFRFSDYNQTEFFTSFVFHTISYIAFFVIVNFIYQDYYDFSEYINSIIGALLYFSFHILMMKFLIIKFKLQYFLD